MSKQFVQNNYNAGDQVYAQDQPEVALIIRRYIDQVYYCKVSNKPDHRELVYFERELIEDEQLAISNKKARDHHVS